jgi:hypothetical protein
VRAPPVKVGEILSTQPCKLEPSYETATFVALKKHFSKERMAASTIDSKTRTQAGSPSFNTLHVSSGKISKEPFMIPENASHLSGSFLFFDEKTKRLNDITAGSQKEIFKHSPKMNN